MSGNPWIQSPESDLEEPEAPEQTTPVDGRVDLAPPVAPQPGVAPPRGSDRFARREIYTALDRDTRLWWMGVHGGAGETTLEQLLEGSRAAGHAWPIVPPGEGPPARVVLVARTNAHGLRSAQLAATEWASGDVPVHLEGLVLLADAPGRLPKPLRQFARLVAGGVPQVWELPWVEAWRVGEPVSNDTAPRPVTQLLEQLRSPLVSSLTHHHHHPS
jgi:hypothetical protein